MEQQQSNKGYFKVKGAWMGFIAYLVLAAIVTLVFLI